MTHTKIVHRAYTLNSSLDFYRLFENFTTYNYKILYIIRPPPQKKIVMLPSPDRP